MLFTEGGWWNKNKDKDEDNEDKDETGDVRSRK